MTTVPNDSNPINFFPLTDRGILKLWTVAELDRLHDICGLGEWWQESERRAKLMSIQKEEIEVLDNIIGEIKVEHPKSEEPKKSGGWVLVSEENILTYDMPGRSGLDRGILEREMDRAHREGRILHMWIED